MRDPYFDIPAMSNSALKEFKKSPKHYQWYLDNPTVATEAMRLGTAAHILILEADKFKSHYNILDLNERPDKDMTMGAKANKVWLNEFNDLTAKEDKEVITIEQFECVERMRDAVHENEFARDLLLDAQNEFEKVILWEENEIKCKGKVDIKNPAFKVDLKTTTDASAGAFQRAVWNMEYYRQAGMYTDGYGSRVPFFFIAVEKTAPFGVAVYKCSEDLIDYGIQEYKDLIAQYKACLESGNWPGYEKDAIMNYFDLELPAWVNHKYA